MDEALVKIRHERSKKDFPGLKLDDDEYVEFAFRRAQICLMMIWGGTAFGLIVILLAFLLVLMGQGMLDDMGRRFLFIILFALLAASIIIGALASRIYHGNKIFITNKHAIQMVMDSPVLTSINIIDLSSVEDASFRQDSLIQKLFHYGTFRLATVGDETTYTFKYSDISPSDLKAVTKLISAAKKSSATKEKGNKNREDDGK
ncbi:hypothetical protein IJH72_01480 [Candidatus Saccharibacteria bacterium]|nr:hypothetical protein [Candidatus Saccharibacteria bacterium]MBR0430693.1 hypothetical protein [Candidatus Saccharibacteria bacterium]